MLIAFVHSFASPADSTKPKRPSTKNDTWYLQSQPEVHTVIDSSIFKIQDYNMVQRPGKEYMNLGNTGTAAYPLVFDLNRRTGFNVGYNQFDVYRFSHDSAKFYQVIRPYVELNINIGLNFEQMFNGKFANQYKGIVFYGVEFNRIFSKGIYQNQRANDNGFLLYAIFNSKNQHWNVQADLAFNSFKVQENGGVATDAFDSSYFNKNLVPVNLTMAENNYKDIDFYLTSSYNLGKKYFEWKGDTVKENKLMTIFKISHRFNIERNTFKYRDFSPDTLYYDKLYHPDSVYNDLNYLKIGNALMLEYHPRKLTSDSTFAEQNFIAYAEAGFDYYLLAQNGMKNNFGDLYVGGTFRNNYAAKLKILYRAAVKYYPYGYNQNDLTVDGFAGYDFEKYGTITGNAAFVIQQAPYIYQQYNYLNQGWAFDLPKSKTLNIGGKYQNQQYGIVADLNYYAVDHLLTTPGLASPYVTTAEEHAFVAHVGNRNSVVGLHLDNDIYYTASSKGGYINQFYPMFYMRNSIYYERRIFKKVLWFATGFDLRYRFKNNAPYYEPLLGSFTPVNQSLKSFPVLDFFLNFKVKTVRIFLKVTNISSSFGPKGYYSAYTYPANDISFMAGVTWRFYD